MFSTKAKGVRYMEMAEGYITRMALDDDDQVIGYEFVKLGKMLEDIRHGVPADEALKNNTGSYGRSMKRRSISTRVKNNKTV